MLIVTKHINTFRQLITLLFADPTDTPSYGIPNKQIVLYGKSKHLPQYEDVCNEL